MLTHKIYLFLQGAGARDIMEAHIARQTLGKEGENCDTIIE